MTAIQQTYANLAQFGWSRVKSKRVLCFNKLTEHKSCWYTLSLNGSAFSDKDIGATTYKETTVVEYIVSVHLLLYYAIFK